MREKLAWGLATRIAITPRPTHCRGQLRSSSAETLLELEAILAEIGLRAPVSTGPSCGVFLGPDAALVCMRSVEKDGPHVFRIGTDSAEPLERILDRIRSHGSLQMEPRA